MTDSASEVGYTVFGNGPCKVIALHGWFGDEGFLAPVQGLLDPVSFTVVSMAYRGYGASRHVEGTYTLGEISMDARALARNLGWDSYNLVGHSMGGKAALRIYRDEPHKVQRIVGIAPVGPGRVHFDSAARHLFERAETDPAARFAIVNRSTGNRLPKQWVQRMVDHSASTSSAGAFGAYLRSWADTDIQLPSNAATPMHVLVGRHDPTITESAVRSSLAVPFPGVEILTVESAGHYPVDEVPIYTAALIERLLSE